MIRLNYPQGNMGTMAATAVIFFSGLTPSSASRDWNRDPVIGLWRLNEAKCRFSSKIPSLSVMRSFEAVGRLTRISETRLLNDGRQIRIEYAVNYDARTYPIFITEGDSAAPVKSDDTVSFWRMDARTVRGEFRNRGTRSSEFTREVSEDGQELRVKIVGSDSSGGRIETMLVYDRLAT